MHPCFVHGLEERGLREYRFSTKDIPVMVMVIIQSKQKYRIVCRGKRAGDLVYARTHAGIMVGTLGGMLAYWLDVPSPMFRVLLSLVSSAVVHLLNRVNQ